MRLCVEAVVNPGAPNLPEVINGCGGSLSWLFEGDKTFRLSKVDAHVWINTIQPGSISLKGEEL